MKRLVYFVCMMLPLLSCDFKSSLETNKKLNIHKQESNRTIVMEKGNTKVSIKLPPKWEVIENGNRWTAKETCSDNFCSNIIHYYIPNNSMTIDAMLLNVKNELQQTYGPSFEMFTTSPISEGPAQVSMTYAFAKKGVSIVGFTHLIKINNDFHLFEVLNDYSNSDEAEERLEAATNLCSSIRIEY